MMSELEKSEIKFSEVKESGEYIVLKNNKDEK